MPGTTKKTVRFADEDEYNYYSRTPSPSFSDTTIHSSPGPMTPPPVIPPYPAFDLTVAKGAVVIHQVLGYSMTPQLFFDLTVGLNGAHSPLNPRILSEPATIPPLPQLAIRCQQLPWTIVINPSSSKPGAFITVADVLMGLHHNLRAQVKAQEYNMEKTERQNAIARAFDTRHKKDHTQHEYHRGVRRVDFLTGMNRFLGLSRTTDGPEVWTLHVGD